MQMSQPTLDISVTRVMISRSTIYKRIPKEQHQQKQNLNTKNAKSEETNLQIVLWILDLAQCTL